MGKLLRITFLGLLLSSTAVYGQQVTNKFRYTAAGVSLNAINYVGELDPGQSFISPGFRFTRVNLGAVLFQRISPHLNARATFSWGRLRGDDAKNSTTSGDDLFRNVRNLSFRNDIYEFKVDAIFDFFPHQSKNLLKRPDYTPYVFAGIAVFRHNPQANYNGSWVNLQPLGTEGQNLAIDGVNTPEPYALTQIAIPFGIGFRYKIAKLWDLAFEIGWRKTFTDYLDDVGTEYVDKALLGSPGDAAYDLSDRSLENEAGLQAYSELGFLPQTVGGNTYVPGYGRTGDQRGDKNSDWYIVTGFQLTYIFRPKVICPKFKT